MRGNGGGRRSGGEEECGRVGGSLKEGGGGCGLGEGAYRNILNESNATKNARSSQYLKRKRCATSSRPKAEIWNSTHTGAADELHPSCQLPKAIPPTYLTPRLFPPSALSFQFCILYISLSIFTFDVWCLDGYTFNVFISPFIAVNFGAGGGEERWGSGDPEWYLLYGEYKATTRPVSVAIDSCLDHKSIGFSWSRLSSGQLRR